MNEILAKSLTLIRQWWGNRSSQQRIGFGFLVGFVCLAAAGMGVLSQIDPYEILYTELQVEEARAVARKLGEVKVPHELSFDNTTVRVPRSQVAKARMELAKAGLPGQTIVGFEKFDSATLGMSSYVQRIQYIRAIQGELTRSIQQLASVKRARVHISIPPKKTFMEEEEPPKASVILELKRAQRPTKGEINGIAHLVSSAVEGLRVSNVSVVDTQGNFLHRPEDSASGMGGMSMALLENQRVLEAEYQKRVEEILTPVVGLGKVRARVAAEMDPSRVNTTEESFDADKAAVRTTVRNEEVSQGTKPNPGGVAGTRSNLPGAEAQNTPPPVARTSNEKNIQNTTYAIPRKIQITDKPSGGLKRLTVAVIVDGYYKAVDGKEVFTPRPDEELKRLQDLVANSVGFDEQRRDSITVSCLPFRTTELAPEESQPPVATGWESLPIWLRGLVLFLSTLVPLSLGLWVFLARGKKMVPEGANSSFPKTVAQLQAEVAQQGSGKAALMSGGEAAQELPEKKAEEELRKRVTEHLTSAPKKAVAVIEEWMDEEEAEPSDPLLSPVASL